MFDCEQHLFADATAFADDNFAMLVAVGSSCCYEQTPSDIALDLFKATRQLQLSYQQQMHVS